MTKLGAPSETHQSELSVGAKEAQTAIGLAALIELDQPGIQLESCLTSFAILGRDAGGLCRLL